MTEFPMHDAAEVGDWVMVRELIEAGVPVDSLDEWGEAPLHRAARNGQYEVAGLLINSECDLNIKDRRGHTPLMLAADGYRTDVVDLLLDRGAELKSFDDSGWTLLRGAASYTGWKEIMRRITDNGEAYLSVVDKNGATPLMWAVRRGDEEVASLLIRAGADVNRSDSMKSTALHYAARLGDTRMIQILLEKEGLHLSPQDNDGHTPLHYASLYFYYGEAMKQLLDAGADTNMKNNEGETALSVGIKRGKLTHEEIKLFVRKGAFLENCDYECISQNLSLKGNVLRDVELCTQSVVNKFNRQSLSAFNSIADFASRLPNVDNFELGAQHIDEVRNLIKLEIERNTFCNVVKVHPISLSALCVLSLITCQSGKKRTASTGFGHSPLKKIRN